MHGEKRKKSHERISLKFLEYQASKYLACDYIKFLFFQDRNDYDWSVQTGLGASSSPSAGASRRASEKWDHNDVTEEGAFSQ